MQLLTDYTQWYDDIFDGEGPTLERMAFERGGLTKREQFQLFDSLGLGTPPHGLVRELADRLRTPMSGPPGLFHREVDCVVYLDEHLHGGLGKARLPLDEALERHPERYASLFIPTAGPATTLRLVRFGRLGVWLRYVAGPGEWRTNVDASVEDVLHVLRMPYPSPIPRVLFAIDFVPSPHGLLALDLNTAPQLQALGASGLVSREELRCELEAVALFRPSDLAQL